jgi:hypothetical protein
MDFRQRIRDLLAEQNLTEWELAHRLSLHRGSIVRLLANQQNPGVFECLLLAGYDANHKQYWLEQAGLTVDQHHLLSRAVGSLEMDLRAFPPEIGADIATFLDFMVNAHAERRKAVQAILRHWRSER